MKAAPIQIGGRCSCSQERVVRFVIPPMPGIPRGEVSCRPFGTAEWSHVRHHDLPAGAVFEIRIGDL